MLKPGGGFQAWFDEHHGRNLVARRRLLEALPPGCAEAWPRSTSQTRSTWRRTSSLDAPPEPGRPLKVWWDGSAALHDAALQVGVESAGRGGPGLLPRPAQRPAAGGVVGNVLLREGDAPRTSRCSNLHARLEVQSESPDVLRLHDLKADLLRRHARRRGAGGVWAGRCATTLRLEGCCRSSLEQFGQHNLGAGRRRTSGSRCGRPAPEGEGSDLSGLRGNGRVDVPEGKLYRLPLLLDLLKAFGLRMPDRTAFEQAALVFAIDGPQLRVQQLDLFGNAISLRGEGTVNLDGSTSTWTFTPTGRGAAECCRASSARCPQAISDQLFKIKMRGSSATAARCTSRRSWSRP